MATKIQWTDESWNPVTGCTKVSEGCKNCYAERMARRLRGRYGYPADEPFRVTLRRDRLEQPIAWKKPRMVFVCSMSDLFHLMVCEDYRRDVFGMMYTASWHTYQVLTKRPNSMAFFCEGSWYRYNQAAGRFDHVWLGVTAENQRRADERVPVLLQTPAAVRFVSVEPMLSPVELATWMWSAMSDQGKCGLDWVIIGCESGPGRRPMQLEWARDLVGQCRAAGVRVFVKQLPVNGRVSHDPAEWPEDLRVRQWPGDLSPTRAGE